MAQYLVQVKNPWGSQAANDAKSLEAQRSDFFTVDFGYAITSFQAILARATSASTVQTSAAVTGVNTASFQASRSGAEANNYGLSLPVANDAVFLARAVDFPDRRVGVNPTKRHEMPLPYPATDEVVGQINITFTMDVPNSDTVYSQVNALMRVWTAVVRAGRAGQDPGELSFDLKTASLGGQGLIPDYRQDIVVNFWRGMRFVGQPDSFFGVGGSPATKDSSVINCGGYILRRAWLAAFQPGTLAHASAGIMDARATFYADAVIELRPQ